MTTQSATHSRMVSSRTSNSSRNDDLSSGTDGTTRKRLQKAAPQANRASRAPSISRGSTDARLSMAGRRRPSIREQKTSISGVSKTGSMHSGSSSIDTTNNSSSRQPSISSTNSHLSFGTANASDSIKYENKQSSPERSEFLTPITFDDFHNSIMDEPNLNSFPLPGQGATGSNDGKATQITLKSNNPWAKASATRSTRSNSIRRQSDLPGTSTESVSTDASMAPPSAPATRARRLSHAPLPSTNSATSNSTTTTSRPPRKSIGPGILPTETRSETTTKRRPSISTRKPSVDNTSHLRLRTQNTQPTSTNLATRSMKAKSLQPLSRETQQQQGSLLTPGEANNARSPANRPRTPGKSTTGTATTPSSTAKRMSIVPHATGLGARTISPTDARRMKRMSMMSQAPPMPSNASAHSSDTSLRPRSSAQSPSMIPRKSVTPSSSRTTPDPNRKSISSGISISSSTSYNSMRNSSGSLQPRLSQTFSTSRLPTPKPRLEAFNRPAEEEVPPVPAIPKAFESPRMDVGATSPSARKASFASEKLSIASDSNSNQQAESRRGSEVNLPVPSNAANDDPTPSAPRFVGSKTPDVKGKQAIGLNRKSLQPLRLPPLNLLPLSTPITSKIDSLKDSSTAEDAGDSTPSRMNPPKTPVTPMTASKASFFFNAEEPESERPLIPRSTTSHVLMNAESSSHRAPSSSSSILPLDSRRLTSPYISSSLSKSGADHSSAADKGNRDTVQSSPHFSKLIGPRPQTQSSTFFSRHDSTGLLSPSLDIDQSASSQRSGVLRHSMSKPQLSSDSTSLAAKFDGMPPPRLPPSATWNGLSSLAPRTSPTLKSSRTGSRRQASISSLTNTIDSGKQGARSSDLLSEPSDVSETDGSSNTRSGSSILAPVHKIISNAKASVDSRPSQSPESPVDPLEAAADEEMRRLGAKRRDFESAAKALDDLRRRTSPKERVGPAQALKMANLNIFERGEIIDFKDIYFCGTQKAKKRVGDLKLQSTNFGYDDERGDYQIVIGDHLAYRYEVLDVLGKGSFGQVVRCIDHKTGGLVAVKIIRNKKRFHQQALVEVNILQKLRDWDHDRRHNVVKFVQSFYFRGHLCISTELLGMNLYEFIKAHDFRGFSLTLIRHFTRQLLNTLCLLYRKKIIHCDLKPENILLVHPLRSEIRVIDFGSSCFEHEKAYTYIQSRFYRSPEVILGMNYGMPIDMWSLGCILAELYTGYPLFPGENEKEQMACIMEVFGPPEKYLIDKSTRRQLFFDKSGQPRVTVSSKGRRRRPNSKDLRQVLKCDNEPFLDFISRCLRWDPARRMNPIEAMSHEFITGVKPPSRSSRSNTIGQMRRPTTGSGSTGPRPLPEPPNPAFRNDGATKSGSPAKSGARPVSMVNGSQLSKRGSSGSYGTSSLPRVAVRSNPSKPDLATAAAATSLKTR